MATLEEAARAVKSSLGTKQNKIEWQIATLGDGKGNVDAGNGYVLVRLKENSSTVEIINDGVSLTDGMLVRIEKPAHDPLHWHVVSKNDQRIDEVSTDPPGYNIGPHHRTHEYLGVDQVNADFRQITNLRVYAVSGTFTVGVLVGLIPRSGTNVKVPSQTLDLTSHVPATGARYCLISVDSTGVLVVTDGSIVDGIITLAITDIPATPTGNWRLAAVRLYAGQTAITESVTSNDMVDLRFPEERIAGNPLDVFGVQTANTYFAGPTTGSPALPTFRAGVTDDIASGVFPIARGGTNGSTATQALTNLLPSQAGQAGNVLGTNGTVASWVAPGGGGGGGTIVITSLPIGTIAPFGGSSIPSGWLECNGAAVSRATYADLFAVTGTTYGAGDGSTTFNLPDMRGRTSIGQGTGSGLTPRSSGQTGGEETHVLITAEMPAHTHGIDLYDASSGTPATTKTGSNAGNIATIQSGSAGSGGAHNTMPPFLVTTWIIKYTDTATSAFLYDDAGATISQVTLTASGTGVRIYAARDDHHHQLDQTIAPTMTGAWTFKDHDVNSIGDDQSAAFIHTQYSATKTASFLGQRARGSLASPSAIQANDTITRLIGRGYGATAFGASHRGAVEIVADENWTDSAQGARVDFYTTPTGGTSTASTAHISNAGQFQGPSIALAATSNQLILQSAGVTGTLTWTPTSSNKTITLPDATGTVALINYANVGTLSGTTFYAGNGAIATPSITFANDTGVGLYLYPSNHLMGLVSDNKLFMMLGGSNGVRYHFETHIDWFDSDPISGNLDLIVWRAGVRRLGIKLGGTKASPQPMGLYISNYYAAGGVDQEYGALEWVSNAFNIGTKMTGDGVATPIQFVNGGTSTWQISDTGILQTTTDDTLAIGATSHRPNSIMVGTGSSRFYGGVQFANIGVGSAPITTTAYFSDTTTTQTSSVYQGINVLARSNPAAPSSAAIYGLSAIGRITAGNAQNHTGPLIGGFFGVTNQNTATLNAASCLTAALNNASTGTIVETHIFDFTVTNGGGGSLTNLYGIYLPAINAATTLNYAIYEAGPGLNRFGDQLAIVGAADRQQLVVTGYTTQAVATPMVQFTRNDAAAGVSSILGLTGLGSGANGDGVRLDFFQKSSTTAAQATASFKALWSTATHASRKAQIIGTIYDTAERQWLQVDTDGAQALTKLGDGTTNYTQWDGTGRQTLHGTARVLKEVQVSVVSTRNGASAPTDANRAVGASGNVLLPVKQFSKTTQNDIYFELHPGSDIDSSVNVAIHFMWLPGSGWTSGNYLWNLEYLVKGENAAPYNTGTPTTITANVTPSNATDTIETVFGSTIALTWNQTIWCHFFRDVADTGDDTGDLRFVEMEYTANKLGE